MASLLDSVGPKFVGHVKITDTETKEVLVDRFNAIHYENMVQSLALSLANKPSGHIYQMVFGNGASTVSTVGGVVYATPNTTGLNSNLYHQTYAKVVDDLSSFNADPANNYIRVNHLNGTAYSDIVVTCNLTYSEPTNQDAFDTAVSQSGSYVFNEIGLKTFDSVSGNGKLLCHVVFHPVQKSLNRSIEVVYTIRIVMS